MFLLFWSENPVIRQLEIIVFAVLAAKKNPVIRQLEVVFAVLAGKTQ